MWVIDNKQGIKWQVKKSSWDTSTEVRAYNPGFGYKWFNRSELKISECEFKFYPVIRTCKDDIYEEFKDDKKAKKFIDELDDWEMEEIARDIGGLIMEDFWFGLRAVVESWMENKK